jgi:hypothetical protein
VWSVDQNRILSEAAEWRLAAGHDPTVVDDWRKDLKR